MDAARRAVLVEIMEQLADDPAMEVALLEEFAPELRACLVALGRQHDLPPVHPDDLDGLAFDACGVIRGFARSWRADGGALPWSYGQHRLVTLLRAHAGPRCRPLLDDDLAALEDGQRLQVVADDPPAVQVLDELVRDQAHPVLVLLRDALHQEVRPDDHELVLLYAQQLADGDPSPSRTVGALLGRRPDAVRQTHCRARKRLRHLALGDPRFRSLLALPLLTESAPARQHAA